MMSHQTSEQTVTQHHHRYGSSPAINYMPTFDPDDEVEGKSPLDVEYPNSFHVSSQFSKLTCSRNTLSQIPSRSLPWPNSLIIRTVKFQVSHNLPGLLRHGTFTTQSKQCFQPHIHLPLLQIVRHLLYPRYFIIYLPTNV